jgi:hypothetical protein
MPNNIKAIALLNENFLELLSLNKSLWNFKKVELERKLNIIITIYYK